MEHLKSKVVVDGIIYPEGIRWSQGRVWFSDILDSKVYAHDPVTERTEVVTDAADRPSGLGFLPDGRLLIVEMRRCRLLRLDPDGLTVVADLGPICHTLNDMVVDGAGRAYLDCHFSDRPDAAGGLILVEPNGEHRLVAEDLAGPNGLAVTPDGRRLFVNDPYRHETLTFDIAADGGLSNCRVFATYGESFPDGLCLDAEGGVWVGLALQGRFQRLDAHGELTHEIVYDDRWAIAPVLGGAGRRSLFLATSAVTLEQIMELIDDPRGARGVVKGWIECVDTAPAPGAGWP